jgi:hypothetical protein
MVSNVINGINALLIALALISLIVEELVLWI